MNILSRSMLLVLMFCGTVQPINWKYALPTILLASGWVYSAFKFHNAMDEKDKEITRLKAHTTTTKSNKTETQEVNWLKKELETKKGEIKTLKEFISNYKPLLDATTVEEQAYTVHVTKLKRIMNLKIDKDVFPIIQESQFCASYELMKHPMALAWHAANTEKDMAIKKRLGYSIPEPLTMEEIKEAPLPPPVTSQLLPPLAPLSVTSEQINTTEQKKDSKRYSTRTLNAVNDLLNLPDDDQSAAPKIFVIEP